MLLLVYAISQLYAEALQMCIWTAASFGFLRRFYWRSKKSQRFF